MITKEEFKENLLALIDIVNNKQKRGFKMKDRLYNKFMEIISYFSNEEIEKLANSLLEYIKNDEDM